MDTDHTEIVIYVMPGCCQTWCRNASHTFHIPTMNTSSDITCKICDCLQYVCEIAFNVHKALRQIGSYTNKSGQVRASEECQEVIIALETYITVCSSVECWTGLHYRDECQPGQAIPVTICLLPDCFISRQNCTCNRCTETSTLNILYMGLCG